MRLTGAYPNQSINAMKPSAYDFRLHADGLNYANLELAGNWLNFQRNKNHY